MDFEKSQVWRDLRGDPGNFYCRASDMERQQFKDWLRGLLRTQMATVTFTKADGETRRMQCTLQDTVIPTPVVAEGTAKKKPNPDVCVVWDINQSAWRSFRWDRITEINFDLTAPINTK